MSILGIETSCDETSVAIVENGCHVHACVVASQMKAHRRHGGVVPELASRMHTEALPRVLAQAFREAGFGWEKISGIAVTHKPGLESALLIGVTAAKTLARTLRLPLYGVDHIHGHIVAPFLGVLGSSMGTIPFPHLALVVSGGHTQIWLVQSFGEMSVVAQTRDDAVGEAFDKVARRLGLGYPGGPLVEKYARAATEPVVLPVPLRHDPVSFSFSGLKTAVMAEIASVSRENGDQPLSETAIANLSQGFQQAVLQHLLDKLGHAVVTYKPKAVSITGGVAANQYLVTSLREALQVGAFRHSALREPSAKAVLSELGPIPLYAPEFRWCTDNAAMIAAAAHYRRSETLVHAYRKLEVTPTGC